MTKPTQMDLFLLELLAPKPLSISEIYRISQVNLEKVDKSLDKLVHTGELIMENKKYGIK